MTSKELTLKTPTSPFALSPITLDISNLDAYIRTVHQVPMLSQEEEISLADTFRQSQDLSAAHRLVMAHLRLVVSIARSYVGYGLPQGDLIQEGNVGLMKAVKRFDSSRGVRLVSFAIHWIKAEIHEYIVRNWRLVKIATTKSQRKLFFNLRSMAPSLDRLSNADVQHISEALDVSPADVRLMAHRFTSHDTPLETPHDSDSSDSIAPIDYLSSSAEEPTQVIEQQRQEYLHGPGLKHALEKLDERSRRIIEARWLTDNDPATLHDLAGELGISAERVRQIEAKAIGKLRDVIKVA